MTRKISFVISAAFLLISFASFGQLREIPKIVRENFANQYPKASNVDFKDQLVRVDVGFDLNGDKFLASYSNKGDWKGTEKAWSFDSLSEVVKDGFEKSKYADWTTEEIAVLYLPGGSEQYRIKAKKSDIQKKYLYFNKSGRLLRESITL